MFRLSDHAGTGLVTLDAFRHTLNMLGAKLSQDEAQMVADRLAARADGLVDYEGLYRLLLDTPPPPVSSWTKERLEFFIVLHPRGRFPTANPSTRTHMKVLYKTSGSLTENIPELEGLHVQQRTFRRYSISGEVAGKNDLALPSCLRETFCAASL